MFLAQYDAPRCISRRTRREVARHGAEPRSGSSRREAVPNYQALPARAGLPSLFRRVPGGFYFSLFSPFEFYLGRGVGRGGLVGAPVGDDR